MDWSNEDYVKLYVRDTEDHLSLSWEARAVWHEMLRKFDRSGLIEMKRGRKSLAALLRVPPEVVEVAIPELVADGRLLEVEHGFFAPNFLDAQEANKSDKLRQKQSRERRRARSLTGQPVTSVDPSVTKRDDDVTDRDAVTKRDANVTTPPTLVTLPSSAPVADPDPRSLPPVGGYARPRDDARRKLWNDAWTFAGLEHQRLKAEGVDPDARNCWSGLPVADSPEARELFARIDELTPGDTPDWDAARETIRNRVLVAAAEARTKHRHLRYMTPMALWSANSFAIASALSPQQVTNGARAGPRSREQPERFRDMGLDDA